MRHAAQRATTLPSPSAAIALTDDVPMSMPTVTSVPTRHSLVVFRSRANAATTSSCNNPLVEITSPVSIRASPRTSVHRPPACSTTTLTAAMSHTASPPTSTAMSIDPSATSMWAQKSPKPRTRQQRRAEREELRVEAHRLERVDRVVREVRVLDARHLRHRHRIAVALRAQPARARPPRAQRGGRDHPGHEVAVDLERDERGPHRDAAGVALGAVDGIDDPAPAAVAPRSVVPNSSPSTASPGRASASRARMISSTARSASVTGVRSGLVSTTRSAARKRAMVMASAASASVVGELEVGREIGGRSVWALMPGM